MGRCMDLNVTCKVLPEYIAFFKNNYLRDTITLDDYNSYVSRDIWRDTFISPNAYRDDTSIDSKPEGKIGFTNSKGAEMPKEYMDLINIWIDLNIGYRFDKYEFDEFTGILSLRIGKKVLRHSGDLYYDYRAFVSNIIVPSTYRIISCNIYDDHSGKTKRLTDYDLRNIPYSLSSLVQCVDHKRVDGMIVETTVIYKKPIEKSQDCYLHGFYYGH